MLYYAVLMLYHHINVILMQQQPKTHTLFGFYGVGDTFPTIATTSKKIGFSGIMDLMDILMEFDGSFRYVFC